MLLSELTYKVVAYGYMNRLNSDDVISWALDMLDLGFTAQSLYIIASISKGASLYEVEPYLKQSMLELGLKRKSGTDALISFCRYYVNEIDNLRNVRSNVKTLSEICVEENYAEDIYDFYKLNCAWIDYEYDPNYPFNHFWEGATAKNIERICIQEAEKWLDEYEERYEQNTTNSPYKK